jgi:anaerobic selenocysteine-containing dehydrogenase
VRNGTDQALMNGLFRQLLRNGWYNHEYVDRHTLGFEKLQATVDAYTPERVAEIRGVPAAQVVAAAELVGSCERLLSTVLQGFYQSNQATAASCQVNNIHLLRGMLGRPGAGIDQMNGQPTAQNTHETGADGDLPGMRNWDNPDHVAELARLWNVDVHTIPHWAPPTHAMQIFRYAEQGSIQLLWISATNPAVNGSPTTQGSPVATSVLELRDPSLDLCQPIGHHPPDVFARALPLSPSWRIGHPPER